MSLSQTLVACGMEEAPLSAPEQPAAAASGEEEQRAIVQATFASLACGVCAPALAPAAAWHVCILTGANGLSACRALKGALESSFHAKAAPLDGGGRVCRGVSMHRSLRSAVPDAGHAQGGLAAPGGSGRSAQARRALLADA